MLGEVGRGGVHGVGVGVADGIESLLDLMGGGRAFLFLSALGGFGRGEPTINTHCALGRGHGIGPVGDIALALKCQVISGVVGKGIHVISSTIHIAIALAARLVRDGVIIIITNRKPMKEVVLGDELFPVVLIEVIGAQFGVGIATLGFQLDQPHHHRGDMDVVVIGIALGVVVDGVVAWEVLWSGAFGEAN